MNYLLQATRRIERSLANLAKNHKSLERIIETKFHGLDIKVTEIQTTVESLKKEVDDVRMASRSDDDEHPGTGLPTTTQFQKMPRSAVVPVTSRAIVSAPTTAPLVAPLVPPVASSPLGAAGD
jgi:hypothetical protein